MIIMTAQATQKSKKLSQTFLFTNFLGFIVGLYTLWHHVNINNGAVEGASFCTLNSYINCDAVALSAYSEFLGYPVAGFLVLFHGALMVLGLGLFLSAGNKSEQNYRNQLAASSFALLSVGLIPTVFLAFVSLFSLKLLCLLCLASYILNLILWTLSLLIVKDQKGPLFSLPPKASWTSLFIVSGVLALTPFIFKGLIGPSRADDEVVNTALYQHFTSKASNISVLNAPSIGPENASITIVEYSDFQCPFCARASAVIPQVVRASSDVRFVFKNFPLDPNCNPTMKSRGHPLACLAAKAGHCVFQSKGSDKFFEYEKSIFAQQASLTSEIIHEVAQKASSLSAEDLKACIENPLTHQSIVDQVNEGAAAGVTGTPAVYINGRRLEYGTMANVLKAAISKYKEAARNAGK